MIVTQSIVGLDAIESGSRCETRPAKSPASERRGLAKIAIPAGQFARVQVWPPQNTPPKAQPCTRKVSEPFSAIVES